MADRFKRMKEQRNEEAHRVLEEDRVGSCLRVAQKMKCECNCLEGDDKADFERSVLDPAIKYMDDAMRAKVAENA